MILNTPKKLNITNRNSIDTAYCFSLLSNYTYTKKYYLLFENKFIKSNEIELNLFIRNYSLNYFSKNSEMKNNILIFKNKLIELSKIRLISGYSDTVSSLFYYHYKIGKDSNLILLYYLKHLSLDKLSLLCFKTKFLKNSTNYFITMIIANYKQYSCRYSIGRIKNTLENISLHMLTCYKTFSKSKFFYMHLLTNLFKPHLIGKLSKKKYNRINAKFIHSSESTNLAFIVVLFKICCSFRNNIENRIYLIQKIFLVIELMSNKTNYHVGKKILKFSSFGYQTTQLLLRIFELFLLNKSNKNLKYFSNHLDYLSRIFLYKKREIYYKKYYSYLQSEKNINTFFLWTFRKEKFSTANRSKLFFDFIDYNNSNTLQKNRLYKILLLEAVDEYKSYEKSIRIKIILDFLKNINLKENFLFMFIELSLIYLQINKKNTILKIVLLISKMLKSSFRINTFDIHKNFKHQYFLRQFNLEKYFLNAKFFNIILDLLEDIYDHKKLILFYESILNSKYFTIELLFSYSNILKRSNQLDQSIKIRFIHRSKIPENRRIDFWFSFLMDMSLMTIKKQELNEYLISNILEENNKTIIEFLFIVCNSLIFNIYTKRINIKIYSILKDIPTNKKIDFHIFLYSLSNIGKKLGIIELLSLVNTYWKSKNIQIIKEKEFIKLSLLTIFIKESLGNYSHCKKLYKQLINNISEKYKCIVLSSYKNFEVSLNFFRFYTGMKNLIEIF
ncbi:RNA polymerase subunit B (nucleomorph) [Bigelowiella natans]|uniref:RNA polymerase subunit B n=1 Tax=Bigelowiella natans TaxID=227086 RepID=Q3LWF3_BIGNA|nr:RNA polymerase subunit B [Bigelowiella natans]ABA27212.1 RNA polymerase subunit B [Bigelowiella natans]